MPLGESKMAQYWKGGGARYSGGHDIRVAGIGGAVLKYIAKYLIIVHFNRTSIFKMF